MIQGIESKPMERKRETSEHIYRVWDQRWAGENDSNKVTIIGRLMFRAKSRLLAEVVPGLGGKSIIDVGCALGYTLEALCATGIETVGIDVSQNAVKACKARGLPVQHRDVKEVDERFDIVFSDGMLEHFINFEPFVEEFCRISNRFVVLIQPNHQSFIGKTAVYLADLIRGEDIVYEYNYRLTDFIRIFDEHNFRIEKNIPVFGDCFRLLVFEKKSSIG